MPSTAAARTTVPPAGESRAIRAATASRTPSGSPCSSVTSAVDSSRPSSPTKNGLPRVRRCTAAATLGRHGEPGDRVELRVDLLLAEPREADPLDRGLAGERAQRVAQRGPAGRLGAAVGGDHGDPGRAEAAGQVDEHLERARVGPLQVVEQHEQAVSPRRRRSAPR